MGDRCALSHTAAIDAAGVESEVGGDPGSIGSGPAAVCRAAGQRYGPVTVPPPDR